MKSFKSIPWTLFLVLCSGLVWAQKTERQVGDTTVYNTLIPEEKQGLLKNVSMIANMNYAFRNEFVDGEYTGSRFRNEQFRLEIRGQVHEKVYFRFRDRYTRAQTSESIDNLSRSVDLAYIRVDLSSNWSISAGKMCADWGAWEFDWNPIDIYEYSDIVEYADNFLTGVGFTYTPSSKNQWTFQVLDSRTKSFEELYGDQPNFTESKAPLAFVANWRGSLLDGKIKTIWSYSLFNEAQDASGNSANMNYIALGNEFNFTPKFRFIYDFKWSDEELDRTGLVSETIPNDLYNYSVANTQYIGHWVNLRYILSPKVHLTFVGMLDISNWKNSFNDPENTSGEEHIRNAWGFIPAVEVYPWENLNMKFFANWVGRSYDYSDYALERFGARDYSTGRFTVGFISPLAIF
ncbi:MAG: OprO/OprP family phosphate-selective porin [Cyclobacteriaceae bacterium]|nr:OprO/OprP family phosphate-selective porin [Cyclobacteriaceae bacterium]MDX5467613.1 OprO/OprP family phosphate-selective porin [Cyclobacteriaceae bacterium]